MFEKTVTNKDGVQKRVLADSKAELDDAVKAVQSQTAPVYPNIDNPDHGNVHVQDFADGKVTADRDREEANPTSDSSKELSRKLADMTKSERADYMNKETTDETSQKNEKVLDSKSKS
jgi:hypothetical protein